MTKYKLTLETNLRDFYFFCFYIPFCFLKVSVSSKLVFFFLFCMESDNFQINLLWNKQRIFQEKNRYGSEAVERFQIALKHSASPLTNLLST